MANDKSVDENCGAAAGCGTPLHHDLDCVLILRSIVISHVGAGAGVSAGGDKATASSAALRPRLVARQTILEKSSEAALDGELRFAKKRLRVMYRRLARRRGTQEATGLRVGEAQLQQTAVHDRFSASCVGRCRA
jgi:hypothetical protein